MNISGELITLITLAVGVTLGHSAIYWRVARIGQQIESMNRRQIAELGGADEKGRTVEGRQNEERRKLRTAIAAEIGQIKRVIYQCGDG